MKRPKYLDSKLCQETIKLISLIYERYPAGGALHIVLDDENTEDGHIKWCINNTILNDFEYYYEADGTSTIEEDRQLFLKCATNLLKMKTDKMRYNTIYEWWKYDR